MLKTLEQFKAVESLLAEREVVPVETVREKLNVSAATARRLLGAMESAGRLLRVHGGARRLPGRRDSYSWESAQVREPEKRAIGALAAALIRPGECCFFDSGTTVLEAARAIGGRSEARLQAVTNSLMLPELLTSAGRVMLTGGVFRPARRDLCGAAAEELLSRFRFTTALLGVDAVSADLELLTTDVETARLNELAMARADRVLLLADFGKFGASSFISYGKITPGKVVVVTDGGLSPEWRERLLRRKIRVVEPPQLTFDGR